MGKKNLQSNVDGAGTKADGLYSHAEGIKTNASKDASHAEGILTKVEGVAAHAEGFRTIAKGETSHAEGQFAKAVHVSAHAEGLSTTAKGEASHTEGLNTIANGSYSHAEGFSTIANGEASHAEGQNTKAQGFASHVEGVEAIANGEISHAEGWQTNSSGMCSHAEGEYTTACARYAHAEGTKTTASGAASHAEGNATTAEGVVSHAEGMKTTARGVASHAEGFEVIASGICSHGEGKGTNTNDFEGAHIMGKFGDADHPYSWYLANGISHDAKGVAAKIVGTTGNMFIDGSYGSPFTAYAEMFETIDSKPINFGRFVTTDGRKIRKANEEDDYILGVTIAYPAILSASGELRWRWKYETDEWGGVLYQEVEIPSVKDEGGREIIPKHIETQPILRSTWDRMREYIPRLKRPEWIAVGMLGQIRVIDDGTCQVNGYCKPNKDGIATSARDGYRVLERIFKNQIIILFR